MFRSEIQNSHPLHDVIIYILRSCWFFCRRADGLIAGIGHSIPSFVSVQLPESHRLSKQSSTTTLQHRLGSLTAREGPLWVDRLPTGCQVTGDLCQLETMTRMTSYLTSYEQNLLYELIILMSYLLCASVCFSSKTSHIITVVNLYFVWHSSWPVSDFTKTYFYFKFQMK
jgi:hypothetical protein